MRRILPLLPLALLVVGAARAGAQGTVSVQGFGYAPGQLGSRAAAMAGGNAEQDPESPINPAALGLARWSTLFFQYAPEFRRVEVNGASERTSALRFPLIGGVARLGERARVGLSVSTLLDRSFAVRRTATEVSGDDTTRTTDNFRNLGGVSDFRFAGSWRVGRALDVGAGLHAITGENRLEVSRAIGDTVELAVESRTLSYSGGALSAGGALQVSSVLNVAASVRRGLDLRVRSGDTLVSRARVPDRMGAGVQYTGITGTSLAARAEYTKWTDMGGIGSGNLHIFDTWEIGAGADVTGPKFGSRNLLLRAGARWRELPFGVGATKVTELQYGGGLGVVLPYERGMLEAGMRRATRDAGSARETAWTLTLGVTVRP